MISLLTSSSGGPSRLISNETLLPSGCADRPLHRVISPNVTMITRVTTSRLRHLNPSLNLTWLQFGAHSLHDSTCTRRRAHFHPLCSSSAVKACRQQRIAPYSSFWLHLQNHSKQLWSYVLTQFSGAMQLQA